MKLPSFPVDAFARELFPDRCCMLEGWLPDDRMRRIAPGNHPSATAIVVESSMRGLPPDLQLRRS